MNAQQLKNSILQEAIEGRLVPQDPNDEPASVLLDKIRKEKARLVKEGKLKKKDLEEIPISEDEIPFKIPESWEWCKLGTVTTVLGGKRIPAGRKLSQENTGHIYIRVSDMKDETVSTDNLLYVPEDIYPSISRYIINKEDVYITVAGTIGKIGKIPPELDGANLTENADRLVFNNISQNWLIRFLQSPFIQLQITDVTTKVGQPKLAILRIQNLLIPLPPLAEQKRIVAKIEELLPKVEEYGKAQESLDKLNKELPERLKKSVLQEAITGRLVPQNPNDEPASVLLDKIRAEKKRLVKEGKLKKKDLEETPVEADEIPFNIPDTWEWIRFGDLVSTSTGKTPARGEAEYWCNNDFPWVSISDMKQGEVVNNTKEFISKKAANDCFHNEISKEGTLIMSFKLTVGRTSILGMDAYHNEAIISIKTYADKDNNTRDYLAYILPIIANSGDSKDAIKGKTLNSTSIYNLFIPLPPLAEQHRIVEKIEQLMKEIDKLKV